jgi:arylsulfatase A-like enzyme
MHVSMVPDRLTANTAREWMAAKLKQHQPFFVNINFADSHYPYQSSIKDSKWFQPCGVQPDWGFAEYPREKKEQVRNTYFNAIHGIDSLIGEILDFLHEQGADGNTIIAVYGDHGESFYENDIACHATLPFDPSVRTGLVLWGKRYFDAKVQEYPASLIDTVPTVLARLGLKSHPNFQGIDVLSPERPPEHLRCLYLHVDGLINGDGLVAAGRWKYFEDNGKGDRYLFDLENDPEEANNLADSKPEITEFLASHLGVWRTAQLAYYRSSRYYSRFFPPPPKLLPDPGLLCPH